MAAFKCQVVSSLVNDCLENISRRLTLHEDFFEVLPQDVKSKLIKKLAMRGLLRDRHLQKVCRAFLGFVYFLVRQFQWLSVQINGGKIAIVRVITCKHFILCSTLYLLKYDRNIQRTVEYIRTFIAQVPIYIFLFSCCTQRSAR